MRFDFSAVLLEDNDYPIDSGQCFRANTTRISAAVIAVVLLLGAFVNFRNGHAAMGVVAIWVATVCGYAAWLLAKDRSAMKTVRFILVPTLFIGIGFAFHVHGVLAAFWLYPVITFFYLLLALRQAVVTNAIFMGAVAFVFFGDVDFQVFIRIIAAMVVMNLFVASFIAIIEKQQEQLKGAAITDALTGLLNRMTLSQSLDDSVQQNHRSQIPMTILAVDLDHFKKINDEHGHDGGDRVLRNFAELLKKRFRCTDKIFRNGGEEFLVLLFDTGCSGAVAIAENLLKDLHSYPGLITTASIGVAEYTKGEQRNDWIKRADDRLYEAKRTGRNRVVS